MMKLIVVIAVSRRLEKSEFCIEYRISITSIHCLFIRILHEITDKKYQLNHTYEYDIHFENH